MRVYILLGGLIARIITRRHYIRLTIKKNYIVRVCRYNNDTISQCQFK